MNEWVRKSIEIANAPGYLDKLHEVYPVVPEGERKIPAETEEELRTAHRRKDKIKLIKALLKLDK